ncbi:PdaC/SigV domain-containing protein [Porphyrobacter sp. HT-58-2]|uniref:PdaC/SigV domain-containing protein n=1 Tax=Porphyrobacter sp. HT-58-2 TaxID=2023229 RepID=UPI001F35623C|nr:DUF4163 domain-containing protein [Porphyrobacter sp. HT-58-2]
MKAAMFHVKRPASRGLAGVRQGASTGQARASAMLARAATGLACVLIAACSSPEETAAGTGSAPSHTTAEAAAPPPAASAFSDNANQGEASREFAYSWPAEAAAIPALAAQLTAERDRLLAEQKAEWAEALAEFAGEDCVACTNRAFEKSWEVVANLPRYLSLSASFYAYTGGAHGNGAFDALVWDREAGAGLDPKAMFRSQAALQDALGAAWCKALKAEKIKRFEGEEVDDSFFPCPPIADLTVLLGSSDRKAFNRIGLIAAPYVAGSYAEGAYEVTLPVTAKVIDAVRPEYRDAFALPK